MKYKPKPIKYFPGVKQTINAYQEDENVIRLKKGERLPYDRSTSYSLIVMTDGSYDIFPTHHAKYIRNLVGDYVVDNTFNGVYPAIHSIWGGAIRVFIEGGGCSILLYDYPTEEQILTISNIINQNLLYWYLEVDFEDYSEEERGTGARTFISAVNRILDANHVDEDKANKLQTLRYFREQDYKDNLQFDMLNRAEEFDKNKQYQESDDVLNKVIGLVKDKNE
jgi:hypothetical protein